MKPHWQHFEHRADIGVRGIGNTLEQAFEQAACAMTEVICPLKKIVPKDKVKVRCEAPDTELLLVDWLNALIYEMATGGRLFSRFEVQLDGEKLTGIAWGEKVDIKKHQPTVEIKGATYTELKVTKTNDGWMAQCVVDV